MKINFDILSYPSVKSLSTKSLSPRFGDPSCGQNYKTKKGCDSEVIMDNRIHTQIISQPSKAPAKKAKLTSQFKSYWDIERCFITLPGLWDLELVTRTADRTPLQELHHTMGTTTLKGFNGN